MTTTAQKHFTTIFPQQNERISITDLSCWESLTRPVTLLYSLKSVSPKVEKIFLYFQARNLKKKKKNAALKHPAVNTFQGLEYWLSVVLLA